MRYRLAILGAVTCAAAAPAQECRPYLVRVAGQAGSTHTITPLPDSSRLILAGGYLVGGVVLPAVFWGRNGLDLPGKGIAPGYQGLASVFDEGLGPTLYLFQSYFTTTPPFYGVVRYVGREWVPANRRFFGISDGSWLYPRPHFAGVVNGEKIVFGSVQAFKGDGWWAKTAWWTGTDWAVIDPQAPLWGPSLMFMFDDGNGPRVHATARGWAPGSPTFARLDNWHWTPLPGNVGGRCVKVYDGGGRSYAYFGLDAGAGSPLIRWDGHEVSDVPGIGVSAGGGLSVSALEVFDDGSGPMLYVVGAFSSVGGMPANNIAKWDGTQWHTLPVGVGGWVDCMAVFDDGRGESLFMGSLEGIRMPGLPNGPVLQLVGCRGQCYPDCNNDDALTLADFGCFQTMYATKNPYADCD
ncbi:MAG: hypothetical protein IT437_03440, partial [Phycisphaerales bacterium]|nr:hypothetical protein [Phycisphaerales bacterium]